MDTRKILQTMADEIYQTNKAYEQKNFEENQKHYQVFRDCLAVMQIAGCKAEVQETWESGVVTLEVKIEGVEY